MIATGGYFRGSELRSSRIDKLLRATSEALRVARGDWHEGAAPGLVVLFVVPGSLGDANFLGHRVTLFSRERKLLQIEAAVPQEVVAAGGSVEFVIDVLRHASRTAQAHWVRKKGGVFDLARADALLDQVRQALLAQTGSADES